MPSSIPIEPRHLLLLVIIGTALCWSALCPGRRDWTLLLGGQVVLAMLVQIVAEVMLRTKGNTHILFNGYVLLEFAVLLGMARAFMRTSRERLVVMLAALPFAAVYVAELWYYDSKDRLATTAVISGGFTLVALYGYLMVRLVDRASRPLFRTPAFWIFAGVVVYFAASAPIVGLLHYLNKSDLGLSRSLFRFTQFLAMVRYAAIAVGLYFLTPGDDRW